jgi:hypothetical protein
LIPGREGTRWRLSTPIQTLNPLLSLLLLSLVHMYSIHEALGIRRSSSVSKVGFTRCGISLASHNYILGVNNSQSFLRVFLKFAILNSWRCQCEEASCLKILEVVEKLAGKQTFDPLKYITFHPFNYSVTAYVEECSNLNCN